MFQIVLPSRAYAPCFDGVVSRVKKKPNIFRLMHAIPEPFILNHSSEVCFVQAWGGFYVRYTEMKTRSLTRTRCLCVSKAPERSPSARGIPFGSKAGCKELSRHVGGAVHLRNNIH